MSLFSHLLVVEVSAGSCHRHVICGFNLSVYLFIFPPGYVALWDSKTPHRPAGESVASCLETSPLLRLPSWNDLHPYLFCLSFYLLYFVLPPFEDNGLPSGCLMSSASIQKLFCGICLAFKCSFHEFFGENVVSPSYSSAILGLPPEMVMQYYSAIKMNEIMPFAAPWVDLGIIILNEVSQTEKSK